MATLICQLANVGPASKEHSQTLHYLYLMLRDRQDCLQRDSNSIWCLGMSELFPGYDVKQTATSVSSDCLSNEA